MRQHALTHKNKDSGSPGGTRKSDPDIDVEQQSEEEEIQMPSVVLAEENGSGSIKDDSKSDQDDMDEAPRSNLSSPSPSLKAQKRPGSSEYPCNL